MRTGLKLTQQPIWQHKQQPIWQHNLRQTSSLAKTDHFSLANSSYPGEKKAMPLIE